MGSPQGATRRGRGRPRTPGADERIIEAALEEYGEHGWSGFTMDGVARRAGVGKSTVYLRWQDKDTLLTDAVRAHAGELGVVDTGTLQGDLEQLATNLFQYFHHPWGWAAVRIAIDAAGAPQPLGRFADRVTAVQIEFVDQIVAKAVERGEITGEVTGVSIAECVYGSVIMQVLGFRLEERDLTDEIPTRAKGLITLLMQGVRR